MELKLEQNRGFYSQKVILSEEPITLTRKIDSKYDTYVSFKNGNTSSRIKVTGSFVIPKEVFVDGVLETNVEVYYKGTLVKRIPCDRLIIQDVDNTLKAIPEIEKLKEEFNNKISEINDKVNKLSEKLDFFIKLWKEEI